MVNVLKYRPGTFASAIFMLGLLRCTAEAGSLPLRAIAELLVLTRCRYGTDWLTWEMRAFTTIKSWLLNNPPNISRSSLGFLSCPACLIL